jgi:Zn-finger nucleic acid-binding protein
MILTDRYDVKINQCPSCKGIWLDNVEFKKVLIIQNKIDDVDYCFYKRKYKQRGSVDEMFDFD